jgi:hypothetical protein
MRASWTRGKYRITQWELVPGANLRASDLGAIDSAGVSVFKDPLHFARRGLIGGGYEAGIMIPAWDIPFILGRFALGVRFGRDIAARHMTLDLMGSPWDPRVRIAAWDGARSRVAWTRFAGSRGREEKGRDVFPGLFFDLNQHAHMYSPDRMTFTEACELFNVAAPPALVPSEEITVAALHSLRDTLRATVDLALAIVTEWNKIGGAAARVPSQHPA